ncbi:MAG: HIT domain-containing protein [Ignavibacteriales bacterium]|nr:HIT domain-containing protein [Ignavibacteriales bacterium]
MERLFSPWRSVYIASFSDLKKSDDQTCLFCDVAQQRRDKRALVVARYETCMVMMNLYPYNSGHLMVIPYRHTADLGALTKREHAEIMSITALMMDVLKDAMQPHGFNLGANLGRVAGAGIDQHIHFHIVPRWNGDSNFMPTLADTKVVSESMQSTYKRILRCLKSRNRRKGKQ